MEVKDHTFVETKKVPVAELTKSEYEALLNAIAANGRNVKRKWTGIGLVDEDGTGMWIPLEVKE